jgi:hypothetical protein
LPEAIILRLNPSEIKNNKKIEYPPPYTYIHGGCFSDVAVSSNVRNRRARVSLYGLGGPATPATASEGRVVALCARKAGEGRGVATL